jgi:hypothetical protein
MALGKKFWVIFTLKMILVFAGCLGLFYYVMEWSFSHMQIGSP